MSWSLGEVQALAVKAARGAGLSWGVAEEAGYAVRWLQANGAPGLTALANLLQDFGSAEYADIGQRAFDSCTSYAGSETDSATETEKGQANTRLSSCPAPTTKSLPPMCPVHTGLVLSDCESLQPRSSVLLRQPLLLLPFVSQLTRLKRGSQFLVTLSTSSSHAPAGVVVGNESMTLLDDSSKICWYQTEQGSCLYQPTTQTQPIQKPATRVPNKEQASITKLEWFAHKTYAPATEESRRKGAGSELTDND